jgi:hypothetical protein
MLAMLRLNWNVLKFLITFIKTLFTQTRWRSQLLQNLGDFSVFLTGKQAIWRMN